MRAHTHTRTPKELASRKWEALYTNKRLSTNLMSGDAIKNGMGGNIKVLRNLTAMQMLAWKITILRSSSHRASFNTSNKHFLKGSGGNCAPKVGLEKEVRKTTPEMHHSASHAIVMLSKRNKEAGKRVETKLFPMHTGFHWTKKENWEKPWDISDFQSLKNGQERTDVIKSPLKAF